MKDRTAATATPAPPATDDTDADRVRFDRDVSPRKRQILEIAAQLFARNGYKGASIRDIGEQAGVLGGSLYHHIKSKDALFVEVHNAALDAAAARIAAAVARETDPWKRLEAACATMLEIRLDPESLARPLVNDFRLVPDDVRRQLIDRRDAFEEPFRALVEALPLPPDIDRSVYRNLLLSALNNADGWYRPGRLTPADVARQITRLFHHG